MADQSRLVVGKQVKIARKEMETILANFNDLGLITKVFGFSRFYSQLHQTSGGSTINRKHFLSLAVCVGILYYTANNLISTRNQCLMESPQVFQTIFRPVEDCAMCRNVREVEKLSEINSEQFEKRYAYSGLPVIVTDATDNWSALGIFSFAFFKTLYQGKHANCQFFPYKTGFHSLQEVFNMTEDRVLGRDDPWYVGWSNCDEKIGEFLRQHYQRPYFLPVTAESEKTDWVFMGSTGYGAPMHVDDVFHPSWQAQITGSKQWTLEPPRECHYECSKLRVTVNPGEIIILDTNRWYHQTKIISKDLSITIGAEYD